MYILWDFLDNHVVWKYGQFYFFLSNLYAFPFSCLIANLRTSGRILNRSGKGGHPCLVSRLRKDIGFLLLLLTNDHKLSGLDNTNWLSYSSVGSEVPMDLTGLKSKCQQDCVCFWRFQGRACLLALCSFPCLPSIPWLMAPSQPSLVHLSVSSFHRRIVSLPLPLWKNLLITLVPPRYSRIILLF